MWFIETNDAVIPKVAAEAPAVVIFYIIQNKFKIDFNIIKVYN